MAPEFQNQTDSWLIAILKGPNYIYPTSLQLTRRILCAALSLSAHEWSNVNRLFEH